LILHELCHLIHQQALGLDCESVKAAYKIAERSGKYNRVLRRDWAGEAKDHDLSYSMVNHKEFFAEMSVTYWSTGYRALDCAACEKMEECSPPITEPNVQARIAQSHPNLIYRGKEGNGPSAMLRAFRPLPGMSHCNKFYPFTSGQLRHYDPAAFAIIEGFWKDIAAWEDPLEVSRCSFCWSSPLTTTHSKHLKTFESTSTVETEEVGSDTVDL